MDIVPTQQIASLLAAFRDADAIAKEATRRADEIKDQLKVAMMDAAQAVDPDDSLKNIAVGVGDVKATLKWVESWRMDTPRLKSEHPEIYAAYAKKSGALQLRVGLN